MNELSRTIMEQRSTLFEMFSPEYIENCVRTLELFSDGDIRFLLRTLRGPDFGQSHKIMVGLEDRFEGQTTTHRRPERYGHWRPSAS